MKVFKRLLATALVLVLLITTFSGCSSLNLKAGSNYISKLEWIDLLGKQFGLAGSVFTDFEEVDYIKLCDNWKILPDNVDKNNGDIVTREYALATAVFALGEEITGLNKDNTSIKKAAAYAADLEIGKSKSWLYMHEGITENEAIDMLNEASRVYTERDFEIYDHSDYNDNLKYQKDLSNYKIDSANNKIFVNSSANTYSEGDIVVFGEGSDAKALKVVGVENNENGVLISTEEPKINEVYDSIDLSGYGTVESPEDITTAEGVQLVGFNSNKQVNSFEKPTVTTLEKTNDVSVMSLGKHTSEGEYNTSDLEFKVELSSGKISASAGADWWDVSAEGKKFKKDDDGNILYKDKNGNTTTYKDENNKPIPNDLIEKWSSEGKAYKGGYKITGSIKLDDLLVAAKLKYNTVDFFGWDTGALNMFDPADSFDVNIDTKITTKFSFEGYLKGEITVADIPIEAGPIFLNLKVKLCPSIDGKIVVKVVFYNSTSVTWRAGSGLKQTSHTDKEKDFEIEVKFKFSAKFELGIGALGLSLIDFEVSVGLELKIKFEINDLVLADEGLFKHGGDEQYLTNAQNVYLLCFDATLTIPIVKVGINTGDSVFGKLNEKLGTVIQLGAEWEIVGGKDALIKGYEGNLLHYEINNGFVDKCLKDSLKQYDKDGDEEESTSLAEETTDISVDDFLGLQIDSYAVALSVGETQSIGIISLPRDCTIDDISVTAEDGSIVSVSGVTSSDNSYSVNVTGLAEGTTKLTFSCNKTNESLSCTIMVIGE